MNQQDVYTQGFKSYLQLEKSLSVHSIRAYLDDVEKLFQYLLINDIPFQPQHITINELTGFIQYLYDLGLSAQSQARIISGIRAFFKYLLTEKIILQDPSQLMELPKL